MLNNRNLGFFPSTHTHARTHTHKHTDHVTHHLPEQDTKHVCRPPVFFFLSTEAIRTKLPNQNNMSDEQHKTIIVLQASSCHRFCTRIPPSPSRHSTSAIQCCLIGGSLYCFLEFNVAPPIHSALLIAYPRTIQPDFRWYHH